MFDLDNLKIINDNLGHQVGDELIQVVAAVCRSELRQNDIACRFGGDEFVIVLPNTGPEQALQFACRLHQLLQTALSRFVAAGSRSEEHTSELQSRENLVCRLLLEK